MVREGSKRDADCALAVCELAAISTQVRLRIGHIGSIADPCMCVGFPALQPCLDKTASFFSNSAIRALRALSER
jgi:hypothetical protein